MLPLGGLGERLTNQLGSMRKRTPGRFNLASLELRPRPFHQPSASRNLMPQISVLVAAPIRGTGRLSRDSLECHPMSEVVQRGLSVD